MSIAGGGTTTAATTDTGTGVAAGGVDSTGEDEGGVGGIVGIGMGDEDRAGEEDRFGEEAGGEVLLGAFEP